jgi:hypothetical protein
MMEKTSYIADQRVVQGGLFSLASGGAFLATYAWHSPYTLGAGGGLMLLALAYNVAAIVDRVQGRNKLRPELVKHLSDDELTAAQMMVWGQGGFDKQTLPIIIVRAEGWNRAAPSQEEAAGWLKSLWQAGLLERWPHYHGRRYYAGKPETLELVTAEQERRLNKSLKIGRRSRPSIFAARTV